MIKKVIYIVIVLLICMPIVDIFLVNDGLDAIFSKVVPYKCCDNSTIINANGQISVCNCVIPYAKYASLYYQIFEKRFDIRGIPINALNIPGTKLYFRFALPFM